MVKRWRKRIVLALLAVVVLFAAIYGAAHTLPARRWLGGVAMGLASSASGFTIETEGWSGWLPFGLDVAGITVGDEDGVAIRIGDVSVDLRVRSLFVGVVNIESLTIEDVRVERIPKGVEDDEPFSIPALPDLPQWLRIGALRADVTVDVMEDEGPTELRVTGSAGPRENAGWRAEVFVESEQTNGNLLAAQQGDVFDLGLTVDDMRWLPRLVDEAERARLSVGAQGPREALACAVSLVADDSQIVRADTTIDWGGTLATTGTAEVRTGRFVLPEGVRDQAGEMVTAVWDVAIDSEGRVTMDSASVSAKALTLTVGGQVSIPEGTLDVSYHGMARPAFAWPWEGEYPPAEAALSGTIAGAFNDFDGVFRAEDGDTTVADVLAEIDLMDGARIAIHGVVGANPAWVPEDYRRFAEESATIAILATQSPGGTWEIENGAIEHASVNVTAEGSFDSDGETLDGRAELEIADASAFSMFVNESLEGRATLSVKATGSGAETEALVTVTGDSVVLGRTTIGSGRVEVTLRKDGWALEEPHAFAATGGGRIDQLVVDNVSVESPVDVTINAPRLSGDGIELTELAVDSGGLRVVAAGRGAPDGSVADWSATITAEDSPLLASLVKGALTGGIDGTVTLRRESAEEPFAVAVDGTTRDLAGIDPHADAFLAGEGVLNGEGTLDETMLRLATLTYATPHLDAEVTGDIEFEGQRGDLELRARSESLRVLEPVMNRAVGGAVTIEATAVGTRDGATYNATVNAVSLVFDRVDTDQVTLSVSGEGRPPNLSGTVTIDVVRDEFTFEGDSPFSIDEDVARLPDLRLVSGENTIVGAAAYWMETQDVEASATIDGPDLSSVGAAFGLDLAGALNGRAEVVATAERLDGALSLTGSGLRLPDFQAASVSAEATVSGTRDAPRVDGTASIEDALAVDMQIETAEARVEGDQASSPFALSLKGTLPGGQSIETRAEGEAALEQQELTLSTWDTTLEGRAIALERPVRVAWPEGGGRVEGLQLALDGGTLSAEGAVEAEALTFNARLDEIPLSLLDAFGVDVSAGTLSGDVAVAGTPAAPEGTAALRAEGIRMEGSAPESAGIAISLESAIAPDGIDMTWNGSVGDAGTVTGNARVRLASVDGGAAMPQLDGPLSGAMDVDVNLEAAGKALVLANHDMRGDLNGSFELSGTPREPRLDGSAVLDDGYYENGSTSTILSGLNVRVAASGRELTLETFEASDGGDGRISATGTLALDDERAFPFSIDAELSTARLVQRDDLAVTVGGTLSVSGDMDAIDVTGDLDLGPASVRPPSRSSPPTLPAVDVREINGGPGGADGATTRSSLLPKTTLNVTCDFPNRVIIRSPVLDSEWQGELRITGTAQEPAIDGVLRILRGYLEVLGRRRGVSTRFCGLRVRRTILR